MKLMFLPSFLDLLNGPTINGGGGGGAISQGVRAA